MDGQPRSQTLLLLLTQPTDGLHRADRKGLLSWLFGDGLLRQSGCCGHDPYLQYADLLPYPSARAQISQSQPMMSI